MKIKKEKKYIVYTGIYHALDNAKTEFRLDYIRLDPAKEGGYFIETDENNKPSIKKVCRMPKDFRNTYMTVKIKLAKASELEAFLKLAIEKNRDEDFFENRRIDAANKTISILDKLHSRIDCSEKNK